MSKHNLYTHPLYRVWNSMRQRCNNSNDQAFKNYGYRGIGISEEWNDFQTFYNDCISLGWEKGYEIDREKNDEGYSKKNCRFVPSSVNAQNRRSTKLNWDLVTELRNIKLLIPKITYRELGEIYEINPSHAERIIKNRAWSI